MKSSPQKQGMLDKKISACAEHSLLRIIKNGENLFNQTDHVQLDCIEYFVRARKPTNNLGKTGSTTTTTAKIRGLSCSSTMKCGGAFGSRHVLT